MKICDVVCSCDDDDDDDDDVLYTLSWYVMVGICSNYCDGDVFRVVEIFV